MVSLDYHSGIPALYFCGRKKGAVLTSNQKEKNGTYMMTPDDTLDDKSISLAHPYERKKLV